MSTHQISGTEICAPVYVWQYPLRLIHWGIVISIAVLSVTGYYIHDPFIYGLSNRPFVMGWFRFVHEVFGMLFLALLLLRIYLFFGGNKWEGWREYIPLKKAHFEEMVNMAKFYLFIRPKPVAKIGHNHMAALSYVGLYGLILIECLTGLVMYQRLSHNAFLLVLVGWIPRVINVQALRLIHFFLMYVFIAFGVFHVHLAMLVSRFEKHGLMDSIFIGYKVIPVEEIEAEIEQDAVHHYNVGRAPSPAPGPLARPTLILGLGNLVHSDDGLGVHAIQLLERNPDIPPEIVLMDGGTQGLALLPHISPFQRLLVIDALDVGEAPGTLVRLKGDALKNMPGKPSVHQLGFADLMVALELLGETPEEIVLLGIQPLTIEWGTELSEPVRAALDLLPALVLKQLQQWQLKLPREPAYTACVRSCA